MFMGFLAFVFQAIGVICFLVGVAVLINPKWVEKHSKRKDSISIFVLWLIFSAIGNSLSPDEDAPKIEATTKPSIEIENSDSNSVNISKLVSSISPEVKTETAPKKIYKDDDVDIEAELDDVSDMPDDDPEDAVYKFEHQVVEDKKGKAEVSRFDTFDSVKAMIEDFSDFSESNKSFKIIRRKPLHIELSPFIFDEDFPEVITEEVKRAVLYGVYRSFIHTNINKIKVTAAPKILNVKKRTSTYAPTSLNKTITMTRKQALSAVQGYFHIKKLSDLMVIKHGAGNQWSAEFNQLRFNDQGGAGLNQFFRDIE